MPLSKEVMAGVHNGGKFWLREGQSLLWSLGQIRERLGVGREWESTSPFSPESPAFPVGLPLEQRFSAAPCAVGGVITCRLFRSRPGYPWTATVPVLASVSL